jgi:hypothetical protein
MKKLLILLFLPLLFACAPPDIRIKRMVAASEVVGTWQLDPKSSALVVDGDTQDYIIDHSKPHEIEFKADGTCRYRSVLQMPTRYVDVSGKWAVVTTANNPKGCEVELELEWVGTYMFSLDIKDDSGTLVLWEFWSDPDLWNFLEYRRKDTEQDVHGYTQ